jgi:hypothetical protein
MLLRRRRAVATAAVATAVLASATALAAPGTTSRGPSTTTDPYVLPVGDGVSIKSLFTVSDDGAAEDGREMVGIPDGLGAYKDPDSRDFTLLMNQELVSSVGAVRRHGQKGAFVTELGIDSDSFAIEDGKDLIDPDVRFWDYVTQSYGASPSTGGVNPRDPTDTFLAQLAAFGRFCSSSLTDPGLLFNPSTGRGYHGQLYFANEETGDEGRVFGVTTDGQAQQLPRLGLFSWENNNAADTGNDVTLTIGDEDGAGGQLWVYRGTKQRTGNQFDKAGLTNGSDFVVDLADEAVDTDAEFRSTYGKGEPARFTLGPDEVVDWDSSGARQNTEATADGLTLNRIEDGVFDPSHADDYYFLTTEGGSTAADPSEPSVTRDGGGLWRLRFKNIRRPELGGTLELLLDGSEAPYLNKPDNMTIDRKGNLLIQEDPGNNAHVARIVAYNTKTGDRGVVAGFDPNQFKPGTPNPPGFITQDEESSGIIDAAKLIAPGWFLFDAQVHKANPDPALVEYGQLLAMQVRKFKDVYTIDG